MNTEAQTAISIFRHFFERYREEMLDDETELMPMVKNILDGVASVSEAPEEAKADVLGYIESCYISHWDEDSREQAQKEFHNLLVEINIEAQSCSRGSLAPVRVAPTEH